MRKVKNIPELPLNRVNDFWAKVVFASNPDNCWDWIGSKDGRKYGKFWINNKPYFAHRVAYFLNNKQDPYDLKVCHSCDNPSCCNPSHLWLGTDNDNMQDMIRKGRAKKASGDKNGARTKPHRVARGEKRWNSKLTAEKVLAIIKMYDTGDYSHAKLGAIFKTCSSNIGLIVNKKRWQHL